MRLTRISWTQISVAAAAAVLLAACQTPTPFQPAGASGKGYADTQLAANRFRVSFTGNSSTKREMVENYLLLRAAQVTMQAGYHWFLFDTRDTEAKTTYQSDFAGWPGFHGRGWYWHSWPYGPGWGAGADISTRPITSYEAYAEIVLLTEAQARDNPKAIRAGDVLDHIGALAAPPPK